MKLKSPRNGTGLNPNLLDIFLHLASPVRCKIVCFHDPVLERRKQNVFPFLVTR
jgi:hypothetical protein